MSPTIHLVRHAQGYHNLGPQFNHLRDPRLTPLGEQQCATLRSQLLPTHNIDPARLALITASPLARTLHTAALVFQDALAVDVSSGSGNSEETTTLKAKEKIEKKILALPTAQETSDLPCDTGSAPPALAQNCLEHGWPVDLSLVHDDWTDKGPDSVYAPSDRRLHARARETRRILKELVGRVQRQKQGGGDVALVTHGGFLHYLTGDWEGAGNGHGTGWVNCEVRSYVFVDGDGDGDGHQDRDDVGEAWLRETAESRRVRGKMGEMEPAGGMVQMKWFEEAMAEWERQGLQTGFDGVGGVGAGVESGRGQSWEVDGKDEQTRTMLSQSGDLHTVVERGGESVKVSA